MAAPGKDKVLNEYLCGLGDTRGAVLAQRDEPHGAHV